MRTEMARMIGVREAALWAILLFLFGAPACFKTGEKPLGDRVRDGGGTSQEGGSATQQEGGSAIQTDASPAGFADVRGQDPATCASGTECSTGYCVDGVCCDTSCEGQCESCKESGSVGTCKAVKGSPVGPREACDGTGICKSQCDGLNGKTCTFPDSTIICTAATCAAGKVATAATCNGAGACTASMSSTCPNSQCAADGSAKCETSCTATSCGAGFYCDITGVCLQGQPDGSSCSVGGACASGYCVEGVCCDGKCDGQCESCKVAGSVGTCSPVKGAPPATRTACGGAGACKGQCDGVNRMGCAFPDGSVVCAPATCAAGKATTASVCNGSGACTTATSSSCASNLCATDGSGKCSGSCTATSCPAGNYCDSTGSCTKTLDPGAACAMGTQCTSGNCTDSVCCDAKCDGQCQSCKEVGSVGKCKIVTGDPISPRAACGGTGKCKAQCNGTSATACTYPTSATECTAAACAAGKVTTASVCNGAGSCTAAATNACDSNLCAADGKVCAGSCTATSCAAGSYCGAGGACAPTIADGKPCSANNQCAHGQCVSGVCCATTCGACRTCATGTCALVPVATACTAGAAAGVCDGTGVCTACTAGASCTTGINAECQTGAISCATGKPVCVASNKPTTTLCGAAPSCSAGRATAQGTCLSGACSVPAPMTCQSGACSGTQCLSCTGAPGASVVFTGITLAVTAPSTTALVCAGASVKLTVTGGSLGSGASWVWYPNVTHSGSVGTGASIMVSPTGTTTYYVRAEGPCNTTTDASKVVTVRPPPQFATQPQSYAVPCNSTALVTFTATPSSGTVLAATGGIQWYSGTSPLENTRYFGGVTTSTLTAVPQSSATVHCVITDVCGLTASSNKATMTVPNQSTCTP